MKLADRGMYRHEFKQIKRSILKTRHISQPGFCGTAGLLEILDTDGVWYVSSAAGKAAIAAPGYTWLQLSPDNGGWWLTVMYDTNNNLVQYYFDITAGNYISDRGEPRFTDLFLDIVMSADGSIAVLDEDELDAAYSGGLISGSQYGSARDTLQQILGALTGKEPELREFCGRLCEIVRAGE